MIKELSEARRMPRLGKIHLGIKKTTKKDGSPCSPYPSEVDYFVCPPEVQAVFGEKPTLLKIMIPVEEREAFFPQFYKRYTTNLLQCKGTGEKAYCWAEDGGLKEIPCPCDYLKTKECKPIGILCFFLPDVLGFGVYQITTSSKNSIIDLNSGLDMIKSICGRIRMIPLILKREKMDVQRIENGQPKKSTHHTLKIDLDDDVTLRQLQQYAQTAPEAILLPLPDESQEAVDDLFPKDGFEPENKEKPEKPKKEAVEEKESQEENESESDDFSDATYAEDAEESKNDAFRTIPLVLSNGKKRIVTKFEAYEKFGNIKKKIGNKLYYEKLGLFGYEHANEIPDKLLPDVYSVLVEAWKESQKKQVV